MVTFLRRFGWPLGALVVLLMAAVMIKLGFWQLDRLAQRRVLNERVLAGLEAPPIALHAPITDTKALEFRRAVVRGVFDHSQEILLLGRTRAGQPGFHVITPLRLEGREEAVLVDRGWVPLNRQQPQARRDLHEPGVVEVQGIIRRSQQPGSGLGRRNPPLQPGEERRDSWLYLAVDSLQQQVPYPLLPIYLERETRPAGMALPAPNPQIHLSEGPHLGYAIQWFSFTVIIVVGYGTLYVKHRRLQAAERSGVVEPGQVASET